MPSPASPHLAVHDLRLTAGDRLLVEDLTWALEPGERLVVVGGNGTGKSTLLGVLAGLDEPAAGRVERPPEPPGMLFQDGALWPHLDVARHLAFVDRHDDPAWRQHLLEAFRLTDLADHRPEALSGGERLRLGLARALASRPTWLLLDEPMAQLDPLLATSLRETLPLLVAECGATQVTITHDPDDVLLFGERLLALGGDGSWWLGDARAALAEPPTPALAAFSDRGTLLSGVADGAGRVDLGLGLVLEGHEPGSRASAFLPEEQVELLGDGGEGLAGTWLAPDRKGGSWLRVDGQLVRSGQDGAGRRAGEAVTVRLRGAPRPLEVRSHSVGGAVR